MVQTRSATRAQNDKETRKSIEKPCSKNSKIVPKSEWLYGYNTKGEAKSRIIQIFKDKNGECGRFYEKETESEFYCLGCLIHRRIKNYGEVIDNNFQAPTFHDCKKIFGIEFKAEMEKAGNLLKKEIISTFTFLKVYANPGIQDFSLPIPLLRYLIKNPKTSTAFEKLVKTCKWFYPRNRLPYVQKVQESFICEGVSLIEDIYEWDITDETAKALQT